MKYRSEQLNELFTALAKAQAEIDVAQKSSKAFNYKYASFPEIIEVSREALTKNNLCVTQLFYEDDMILSSVLGHGSGQWVESRLKMIIPKGKGNNDMWDLGSAITYLRRYAYASLIGVVAEEQDNDAGQFVRRSSESYEPTYYKEKITPEHIHGKEKISSEELNELMTELDSNIDLAQRVMKSFNIERLADIPKCCFLGSLRKIREINLKSKK